ncbi:Lrp/AsnC family transcriptional regulator [Nocardia sp. NPDC046763]|uniref:Lrp/AsnC family transcriptional regulator n=1 Tax=Nocardia sp. NPDC046763 TaxID=3155256 RepID=UPI0033FE68E9
MRENNLDEVDLMLLDALHANPRVSFERLGPALGVSAATAARRWQRLSDSGRAWVSSVPGPQVALVGAVCEVRAQPGRVVAVAAGLASIPQVMSVYGTDGEFDLHTLVLAESPAASSTLLLERLPAVPGIARVRSTVALQWHSGVHWRLGAIDSDQQRSVTEEGSGELRKAVRYRTFEPGDRDLFLALQHDGRAGYRDLARELNTSEHLVRRRLDALVRRGMLAFRTDFARGAGGWPTEYVLWLSVPYGDLDAAGTEIASWPETRICLSTVGRANIMMMAQVHRIADLSAILGRIATALTDAVVVDQRLVLRAFKSWGRLLDSSGHAVGVVPVNPWAAVADA